MKEDKNLLKLFNSNETNIELILYNLFLWLNIKMTLKVTKKINNKTIKAVKKKIKKCSRRGTPG